MTLDELIIRQQQQINELHEVLRKLSQPPIVFSSYRFMYSLTALAIGIGLFLGIIMRLSR